MKRLKYYGKRLKYYGLMLFAASPIIIAIVLLIFVWFIKNSLQQFLLLLQ